MLTALRRVYHRGVLECACLASPHKSISIQSGWYLDCLAGRYQSLYKVPLVVCFGVQWRCEKFSILLEVFWFDCFQSFLVNDVSRAALENMKFCMNLGLSWDVDCLGWEEMHTFFWTFWWLFSNEEADIIGVHGIIESRISEVWEHCVDQVWELKSIHFVSFWTSLSFWVMKAKNENTLAAWFEAINLLRSNNWTNRISLQYT